MTETATLKKAPAMLKTAHGNLGTAACPECGRLADVADRFTLDSTDGPVEHILLRCVGGRHYLTLIDERQ